MITSYADALATDGYVGGTYQLASRGYVILGLAVVPAEVGPPIVFLSVTTPAGSVTADLTVQPGLFPSPSQTVPGTPPPVSAEHPGASPTITVPFLGIAGPPLPDVTPTPPTIIVQPAGAIDLAATAATPPPRSHTTVPQPPSVTATTGDRAVDVAAASAQRPSSSGAAVPSAPKLTVEVGTRAIDAPPASTAPPSRDRPGVASSPGLSVTVLDDDD